MSGWLMIGAIAILAFILTREIFKLTTTHTVAAMCAFILTGAWTYFLVSLFL